MSQIIEKIIEDIICGRIKVDDALDFMLPSPPERYMLQYGDTSFTPHA
jgi:hypothetical protein